ncbi:MAG: hypothetical protein ABJJ44_06025 [Paraglaciecola sp.]|uniref:hypothetical protein n=1 Tax=Paraglaciecola sp. TaxID=1920173 RepID=UPI003298F0C8
MAEQHQYIFHIGLPKSASSTFQKQLFPFVPNINNFALYPTNNVAGSNTVEEAVNSVYLNDKRLFEFYKSLHNRANVGVNELASMWKILLNEHGKHNVTLLSHEAMTSAFFSSISVPVKLARIKSIFANVKVCIVIRDQFDWLHSQYTDHPFDPLNLGKGKPYTFEQWMLQFLTHPQLVAARDALNYFRLVTLCYELFSPKNVSVVKLAWLKKSPQRFYKTWSELLNVEPEFIAARLHNKRDNRGLSGAYNRLRQRQRSHKLSGLQSPITNRLLAVDAIKLGPKAKYSLSAKTHLLLTNAYAEPNAQLNNLMGW